MKHDNIEENDTIIYSNEFFNDISFIDYDNINIKRFFYDISFDDYSNNIDNNVELLVNI